MSAWASFTLRVASLKYVMERIDIVIRMNKHTLIMT